MIPDAPKFTFESMDFASGISIISKLFDIDYESLSFVILSIPLVEVKVQGDGSRCLLEVF